MQDVPDGAVSSVDLRQDNWASPIGGDAQNPFRDNYESSPVDVDSNPYAAPTSSASDDVYPGLGAEFAGRGRRLVGFFLDGFIHLAGLLPGMLAGIVMGGGEFDGGEIAAVVAMTIMTVGFLGVLIGNWVLISITGQSYAKRILGMRIVKSEDGRSLPGFVRGVVLRQWLPFVINQFCGLFFVFDALFIFGENRQCVHDMIAKTVVVDATPRAVDG